MKVLVTGGAGFIGRHTVRRLLDDGAQVLVLDDFSSSAADALDQFAGRHGFEAMAADICDQSQVQRAFAHWRPEATVHLAGLVSVARSIAQPEESHRLNVGGTRIVAEAAQAAGCRRFVFASSAAVYADSTALPLREDAVLPPALAPYGANKAESERLLRALGASGIEPVLLRYFNVYGAGQPVDSPYSGVITRFLDSMARGLPLRVYGDGEQSRDFIHVDDVAGVNARAVTGEIAPAIYNVCSGIGITINTLVATLREWSTGTAVEYMPSRPGEIRHSTGSPEALAAALPGGWAPRPLAQGLHSLWSSFPKTGAAQ